MRAEMRQLIAEDAKTQQSREHLETELAQVQSSLLANKAEKKDSERQKKSQEAREVRKPLRPLPHAPLDARARALSPTTLMFDAPSQVISASAPP